MNNIRSKNIAIIGAGPGGLTLARLLQMNGLNVKVYERDADKDARPKGATLDLHDESGLAAIRAAGLWDAFMQNYRPGADRLRIVDKHTKIWHEDDAERNDEFWRPEIDRGPLQKILLDSLLPGTVVWDRQFAALTPDGEGWTIAFKNGLTEPADIVIAADGANSKLRPYLTDIKPFFVGITAIEASVYNAEVNAPNMHKLLNGGKIFALDDSKSLIVSSKGDGSLVYYPGFKTNENWVQECGIDFSDKMQVLAWFKQEYKGWDDAWDELFENTTGNFIPRPQYCMPLNQTWEAKPNLTMLGDAAHLMPPYAGEGVNMAMLDALELSRHLLNHYHPDTLSAIASYETQMRKRASEMAGFTLQNTDALHADGALQFMVSMMQGG
ncbi:FAD-dependent oxidoreductase [Mucilaginibacter lutimaris]|uniref:Flavin-dependent monooxygenase n=1 Tax=Mucilaginibacter lutimaris TaxID=931629 RepID=A0ABW2ZLC5_9SPHI